MRRFFEPFIRPPWRRGGDKKERPPEQHQELEKGDWPALIIAAVITFLPPILLVLAIFYLFARLFFHI